jgi:hypothetical protein
MDGHPDNELLQAAPRAVTAGAVTATAGSVWVSIMLLALAAAWSGFNVAQQVVLA